MNVGIGVVWVLMPATLEMISMVWGLMPRALAKVDCEKPVRTPRGDLPWGRKGRASEHVDTRDIGLTVLQTRGEGVTHFLTGGKYPDQAILS